MKGIILAGGKGTRLFPLTLVTSKALLPVYDKPMIYYPLSILMIAGIKDVLVISTDHDLPRIKQLLGDGSRLGMKITHIEEDAPLGIAHALVLGKDFIGDDACALILGDNVFYGDELGTNLKNAYSRAETEGKATIFGYEVPDPERFGIVKMDEKGNPISLEEKPQNPKSNYCVTGLYFYPQGAAEYAKSLSPSARGELEITSLNNIYLDEKRLVVEKMGKECVWLDAGTHDSLVDASSLIKNLESKLGYKVSCPEEIAYRKGWISKEDVLKYGESMKNNQYGQYLINVSNKK